MKLFLLLTLTAFFGMNHVMAQSENTDESVSISQHALTRYELDELARQNSIGAQESSVQSVDRSADREEGPVRIDRRVNFRARRLPTSRERRRETFRRRRLRNRGYRGNHVQLPVPSSYRIEFSTLGSDADPVNVRRFLSINHCAQIAYRTVQDVARDPEVIALTHEARLEELSQDGRVRIGAIYTEGDTSSAEEHELQITFDLYPEGSDVLRPLFAVSLRSIGLPVNCQVSFSEAKRRVLEHLVAYMSQSHQSDLERDTEFFVYFNQMENIENGPQVLEEEAQPEINNTPREEVSYIVRYWRVTEDGEFIPEEAGEQLDSPAGSEQ